MSLAERIKPRFWSHEDVAAGPYKNLFNFRRIWKLTVFLTSCVVLIPLVLMAFIDYKVSQDALESEILLRTSRLVSNTRRTVSYFLDERRAALDFIDQDNSYEELNNPERLAEILENLKKGFGGFVDLGVIDAQGKQRTYVGPYNLEGKDYSDQDSFKRVVKRGVYVSDVFLGFRNVPHLVIAVRHNLPGDSFYILRTTIDTEQFNKIFSGLELSGRGAACLINEKGQVQTPCKYQGTVLQRSVLPIPPFSERTRVDEIISPEGKALIYGYAYIQDSPFILTVVKQKDELMRPWYQARMELFGFLGISILAILVVILGGASYLVNQIYVADQRRVMTLHQVEYSNKMASIGRMAAAVAHEINNPLAIINEKAGLIKDLFVLKRQYAEDPKLITLIDAALAAVDRCSAITRRLLSFARHMEVISWQSFELRNVIDDVLGFFSKEAELRGISLNVDVAESVPSIESDRGKLQQIILNVVNNAFNAMDDGGHLWIQVKPKDEGFVSLAISDDGSGIAEKDLEHIFEPFFTTKAQKGGTGLGLSITYSLVQELNGTIQVTSKLRTGTTFVITLPVRQGKNDRRKSDAGFTR
jgi:signal transduction histidine kinase